MRVKSSVFNHGALRRIFVLSLALIAFACSSEKPSDIDKKAWVGTWATAQQLVESGNMPPEPGLAGNTLRQIVRVSIGGTELRARLSNEFGSTAITLNAVHLAIA